MMTHRLAGRRAPPGGFATIVLRPRFESGAHLNLSGAARVGPGSLADDPDLAVERLPEFGGEGGESVGVTTKIRSSSLVMGATLSAAACGRAGRITVGPRRAPVR
jgi:hypothetical protein